MLRTCTQRPVTPNKLNVDGIGHWSSAVYESYLTANNDGSLDLTIEGGSDNGEFPYFGYAPPANRSISTGDVLLEIEGQKVAGYTQRDVITFINHCVRNGNSVKIKAVKSGMTFLLLLD